MVHMGAMPHLRKLRIQETVATDEGFVALSRSRPVDSIWGRECPHLGDRGFRALAGMPSLRRLGVGLANMSPDALAALGRIRLSQELTPIGMRDDGFVHVGRCEALTR